MIYIMYKFQPITRRLPWEQPVSEGSILWWQLTVESTDTFWNSLASHLLAGLALSSKCSQISALSTVQPTEKVKNFLVKSKSLVNWHFLVQPLSRHIGRSTLNEIRNHLSLLLHSTVYKTSTFWWQLTVQSTFAAFFYGFCCVCSNWMIEVYLRILYLFFLFVNKN